MFVRATLIAFAIVATTVPFAIATHVSIMVDVSPSIVQPGGTLIISVQGCDKGGQVTSNAFTAVPLLGHDGVYSATAYVHYEAAGGVHDVHVECSGQNQFGYGNFVVQNAEVMTYLPQE